MAEKKSNKQHKHPQGRTTGLSTKHFVATPWAERSIDEIKEKLTAPTNDHDAYFNFRSPPEEWEQASSDFSQAHLFFHAVKKENHCKKLQAYRQNRNRMREMTNDRRIPRAVRKMLTSFMLNRPEFAITELTPRAKVRHCWNAWDEKTLKEHHATAKDSDMSATILWLVYSSASMATSEYAGASVDELTDKLVAPWYGWLEAENNEFKEVLSFVDKWLGLMGQK